MNFVPMHRYLILFIFSIISIYASKMANANDPLAKIPVLDRSFPGFSPKGFRVGSFLFVPTFDTSINYTTNTTQSSDNEISESIYNGRIGGQATAEFGRHKAEFNGFIEHLKYQKTDDFDHINFKGTAKTAYQISSAASIAGEATIERRHQTRYDVGTIDAAFSPIAIDEYGFIASLNLKPKNIRWGLTGEYKRSQHENADLLSGNATIIQSDRDRSSYGLSARASFEQFSSQSDIGFTPFLGISVTRNDFDRRNYDGNTGNFTGVDQSNMVYSVNAGIDMKSGGKLQGSVNLGYASNHPDDKTLNKQSSGVVDIDLTYLYSPLTNFTFDADRFFTNDTDSSDNIIETKLRLAVIHELTRRWIINSGVSYTTRDFKTSTDDSKIEKNIGFTHRFNQNLSMDGDLKFINRESGGSKSDETRAMIRLRSKF